MIPYNLLSQISLVILAVALTMTYISPTFTNISDIQNKISVYQQEKAKVASVNQTLDELVKEVDSVSVDDHKRLLVYMPDSVDTIAVPRDIQAIANDAGVVVRDIKYEGAIKVPEPLDPTASINVAEPHSFVITFESSYEQLKTILSYFEQNHYPLEVTEMQVQKGDDDFLSVTLKLLTYDHTPPPSIIPEALQ